MRTRGGRPAGRRLQAALAALVLGCASSSSGAPQEAPLPAPVGGCSQETSYRTDDPALDALQAQFRPVLESNRQDFVGQTGHVQGFGGGSSYPQLWLRDGATLFPGTRYLYPRDLLVSWLEEHLSHQAATGGLWDWIAQGEPSLFVGSAPRAREIYRVGGVVLTADKNTTAADQEASAVDAAWSVFQMTGDTAWLLKPIAGRRLLDRLDAALGYVLERRLDEGSGLVTSAFTADWGDVSPAHDDQRAIYLDDETPVVVGLYSNAFFLHAAEQLSELQAAVGNFRRMEDWRETARSIRGRLNRRLWQEDRGFYRLHELVGAPTGSLPIDDSGLFAMGGNALAVLYGVAETRQAERIFAAAEARRQQYGLSSVAGVLLPSYPPGFFSHPLLRDAYAYQNGGQWDWWAGRLLLAMFQRGRSAAAYSELRAVARRISRSGGLYEWYTPDDQGRGSDRYAGNVGALSAAVYQGLFGLDSWADGLRLTVRLGDSAGSVRTCEPATQRRIAYDYRVDPVSGRVRLAFEASVPGEGRLAIRLPVGWQTADAFLDGARVKGSVETVGEDRYLVLSTDWSPHAVELRPR